MPRRKRQMSMRSPTSGSVATALCAAGPSASAKTGPDGALYVADFYRFVLEHPEWIAPETLNRLDVRAGAEAADLMEALAAKGVAVSAFVAGDWNDRAVDIGSPLA